MHTVFYISDGTAITAEVFGHAVLSQFPLAFEQITIPFVETQETARQVRMRIDEQFRQTGVTQLRLDGRLYRPEELRRLTADYCRELLALQKGMVVPPPAVKPGATRGHYFRGVMMHDQ